MVATDITRSAAWRRLAVAYVRAAGGDDAASDRKEALCAYVLSVGPYLAARFGSWPLLGMGPEDAASEACVRVVRFFDRLAPEADAAVAVVSHANWAYVVLRSVVRDWQRASGSRLEARVFSLDTYGVDQWGDWDPTETPRLQGDDRDAADYADAVADRLGAQWAVEALRETLGAPDAERLALLLDVATGAPYRELAEAWGLTHTHFRTRVVRARRALAGHPVLATWRAAHA